MAVMTMIQAGERSRYRAFHKPVKRPSIDGRNAVDRPGDPGRTRRTDARTAMNGKEPGRLSKAGPSCGIYLAEARGSPCRAAKRPPGIHVLVVFACHDSASTDGVAGRRRHGQMKERNDDDYRPIAPWPAARPRDVDRLGPEAEEDADFEGRSVRLLVPGMVVGSLTVLPWAAAEAEGGVAAFSCSARPWTSENV